MNFNDLKTGFLDALQSKWSDLQETSLYIQLRDRYEELSPNLQRLIRWCAGLMGLVLVLLMPLSWMSTSAESIADFEEKKELIRDLLRLKRDLANSPNIAPPISSEELKGQVDGALSQIGLTPEQKKDSLPMTFQSEKASVLIPSHILQNGVQLTLTQLTLKQIVDVIFKVQSLSEMVKVTAVDIKARAEDDHYYDMMLRVVNFDLKHEGGSEGSERKKQK